MIVTQNFILLPFYPKYGYNLWLYSVLIESEFNEGGIFSEPAPVWETHTVPWLSYVSHF